MCMDFSFDERPSVHVNVYGILDPSTQWQFESMCMEFSIVGPRNRFAWCVWIFQSAHVMAIWIEVHRFSSRLLHHQLRWMCMAFSIGGQIRWSRQCIWSFRSEHVAGIWIDVYGIFNPQTAQRICSMCIDFSIRVLWWWPQSKCVNISSVSVKLGSEKCLKIWGNPKRH